MTLQNRNNCNIYAAAALSFLVPTPGRTAYGIIVILFVNLLVLLGTLTAYGITALKIGKLNHVLQLTALVMCTILFKQLLSLYSPVLALTLGFSFYLIVVSSFVLGLVYTGTHDGEEGIPLSAKLRFNCAKTGMFSLYALLFYTVRDIAAFGTLTFPVPSGLVAYRLFEPAGIGTSFFLNSIPFAVLLVAFFLAVISFIQRKLEIAGRNN